MAEHRNTASTGNWQLIMIGLKWFLDVLSGQAGMRKVIFVKIQIDQLGFEDMKLLPM